MFGFRHTFLLLTILSAAALLTSGPAVAAVSPPTTTQPAAAAAGWLSQQFVGSAGTASPTGDHFDFPGGTFYWGGLTASGIFALAAADAGKAKIDTAISYMEHNVAGDANLGNGDRPGPFDGSVATAALAAIVGGVDPTEFGGHDLLHALERDQCTAVSAPTSDTDFVTPTCPAVGSARNIFSSVSESLAILAEARSGAAFPHLADATAYFLSLQCKDGGFTVGTSVGASCTSDVDATAYAVAALIALGGHAGAVAAAVDWLTSERTSHGYWVTQGGADVDSTGLAASAMDAAGEDTSTSRAWLASQQVTTGPTVGPGASRGALRYQGEFDPSSSIKATADGLLGMVHGVSLANLTDAGAAPGAAVLALPAPEVSSASVAQGAKQTVTATGFAAGEKVGGVLHSAPVSLGHVTADRSGTARIVFTIPKTVAAGTHRVVLTGLTSGLSSDSRFIVTTALVTTTPRQVDRAVTPPASGDLLADTGLDGGRALADGLFGLGCVVAGAGALYLGRRRHT